MVSGGRYDGLVERFTGEKVPATGISIGVSRLLFGLQRLGKFKDERRRKARSSCSCSIATASPTTRRWRKRFARRTSAPSFISARPA